VGYEASVHPRDTDLVIGLDKSTDQLVVYDDEPEESGVGGWVGWLVVWMGGWVGGIGVGCCGWMGWWVGWMEWGWRCDG
jgi:hypothetical protein